jgi:hypothetical protein
MPIPVDYKSIITRAMHRSERRIAPVIKTADMFRGQIDYFNFLATKKAGLMVASAQMPMQIAGPGKNQNEKDFCTQEYIST